MKILFLTENNHVDYQCDCLLIGLREIFGEDVVDYIERSHCYESCPIDVAKKMYGKGFTVTRYLPSLEIDRTNITQKIKNRFFDYIIFGSIWRGFKYILKVLEYYPKSRVIVIDGEDETSINPVYKLEVPYFKRELVINNSRIFPISFSMPTSKGIFCTNNKNQDLAICDPRKKSTYIYNDEELYYQGYQQSRFGVTTKRAGWDCLRHYEILSNGCIPLFFNIWNCPSLTMTSFPKELCFDIYKEFKKNKNGSNSIYDRYIEKFKSHFLEHNTTKAEATKFLNTIKTFTD